MSESLVRVPRHLQRYVVAQDYTAYNEVDQAVWRFVLLQTHARLRDTAHAAYRDGLELTGISVERIPRIQEMDACLSRFGWGAVAVDGFIPPRAFQEFQACGILPIAADIRTKEHLVYTPAPDIIHESAGHAPILVDATYSEYLRRLGAVGQKAFASPEDARVYAAIFELSEIKEAPNASPAQVRSVELALERALAAVSYTSEASRLSRLYWWTAEYGLIGTPDDYKLYGAGLLSSLWESYSCHDPAVAKLPISKQCVDVGYDITRPQPQLFVAQDFEQLFDVLSQVDGTLAYRRGGAPALAEAIRSEELATVELEGGAQVSGVLEACDADETLLSFSGPVGLYAPDGSFERYEPEAGGRYRLPLGLLAGGTSPREAPARPPGGKLGERVGLRFESGVLLEGRLLEARSGPEGELALVRLGDYRIHRSGEHGFSQSGREYLWLVSPRARTAFAGAPDARFFPELALNAKRVPKPRRFSEREQAIEALYERAAHAFREQVGSASVAVFESVHEALQQHYTDEWLLRWNLLECLYKLGRPNGLARSLTEELESLEVKFAHREPIASGLRYLARLAA